MKTIQGRIWKFGDSIDTDIIIPARYLILPLDEMKEKAMEPLRPAFASDFEERRRSLWLGGILAADRAREQASRGAQGTRRRGHRGRELCENFLSKRHQPGSARRRMRGLGGTCTRRRHCRNRPVNRGRSGWLSGKWSFRLKAARFLLEIIEDGGLVRNLTKDRR